jgi:hypothetical protein
MTPSGIEALTLSDDARLLDPVTPEDWDEWVSASRTRAFCLDDPLLDWFDRFGAQHGFVPDDELDGYDQRTDMRSFVFEHGRAFEEAVVGLIRGRFRTVRIAQGRDDVRLLARAVQTFEAMRRGVPVIEQGVLRNPQNRTYGAVDLLMRSDVMNELVPDCIEEEEARVKAPALGSADWHYRAIDIKFHILDLLKNGHVAKDMLPYMVQVWIYNEALGRIQGHVPPAAYLLGRCWKKGDQRGLGCFERIGRVDHGHLLDKAGGPLSERAFQAVGWIRRMRHEGAGWRVLPEPSVPELYPHARNHQDQPWQTAKAYLANQLAELTLLPGISPTRRRQAHAAGLKRWDDPAVNASSLGIEKARYGIQCDAVLMANRGSGVEVVIPDRLRHADQAWRDPAPLELYVDFETVSNLDDDFSALPAIGGQPLIFQIGCGWYEEQEWSFAQWTVDQLTEQAEAVILDGWVGHMDRMLGMRGLRWQDLRLMHWSPAEWVNLSSAYNSARKRHPEREWPELKWYDVLHDIIHAEPVSVRGAFNFGLKSIAKGMHRAGLIQTDWAEGPVDGLGAMVGAWWCAREAALLGTSMRDLELMKEIGKYNEVDCRAMAEVVGWLRANR